MAPRFGGKVKASREEVADAAAEIDAKEFQQARDDSRLRSFVRAAYERLEMLRAASRID